jgi:tetratricopeptide (TPR) repeat protein
LATSAVERAQGKLAEAVRWLEQARKLAPTDEWLADLHIELLVTQGRTREARALLAELPGAGSFLALARESSVVLAEGGSAGLHKWLLEREVASKAETGADLTELARIQYLAGEFAAAHATLAHAQRILPLSAADLVDGSQIRHDYSAALFRAGIELKGGGDAGRARELLGQLDRMLANYENNGGRHYGMYSLRAASLAMQGNTAEAEAALDTAWKRGWRTRWRAKADPFLGQVRMPGD